jgi:hypothetical protein
LLIIWTIRVAVNDLLYMRKRWTFYWHCTSQFPLLLMMIINSTHGINKSSIHLPFVSYLSFCYCASISFLIQLYISYDIGHHELKFIHYDIVHELNTGIGKRSVKEWHMTFSMRLMYRATEHGNWMNLCTVYWSLYQQIAHGNSSVGWDVELVINGRQSSHLR